MGSAGVANGGVAKEIIRKVVILRGGLKNITGSKLWEKVRAIMY